VGTSGGVRGPDPLRPGWMQVPGQLRQLAGDLHPERSDVHAGLGGPAGEGVHQVAVGAADVQERAAAGGQGVEQSSGLAPARCVAGVAIGPQDLRLQLEQLRHPFHTARARSRRRAAAGY
jgi:hypothetical protein